MGAMVRSELSELVDDIATIERSEDDMFWHNVQTEVHIYVYVYLCECMYTRFVM